MEVRIIQLYDSGNNIGVMLAKFNNHSFGYMCRCGKCRLSNIKVKNQGIDWGCKSNIYWQNKIQRLETLEISLEEDAEFEAHNVAIEVCRSFSVLSNSGRVDFCATYCLNQLSLDKS